LGAIRGKNPIVAGVLAWLVPGLGHLYAGMRARGLVIFVAISLAFWTGVVIGGAQSTVSWDTNRWWFAALVFTGGYTMLTMAIGKLPSAMPSYGKTLDLATIYTGVAGLLNILVILDAIGRVNAQATVDTPARKAS